MNKASTKTPVRRCAVYTRKSSEEGLEQDFNSLHAQREACEAYIRSQQGEGWRLVEAAYDDGGVSGGTMDRPGLQRLLADVALGKIDVVVVYKVDRLTRSLADFAKMVEVFDGRGASFVAVTQQFNTTTSMGRLTLNVLLSFAQFEREVTGERIRDKIAASKQKGMWMGGPVPLGYRAESRTLIEIPEEAEVVRDIYRTYLRLGNVRLLKGDLDRRGVRSKRRISVAGNETDGALFSRGALYALLGNPLYIGKIRHGDTAHPGLHAPIVDLQLWDSVQTRLKDQAVREGILNRKGDRSWLIGKLVDETGRTLTTSHAVKGGKRYRYYVSRPHDDSRASSDLPSTWRLPAAEIEGIALHSAAQLLTDHALIVQTAEASGIDGGQVPPIIQSLAYCSPETAVRQVRLQQTALIVEVRLKLPFAEDGADHLDVAKTFPIRIKRRGIEMRMVLPGQAASNGKVDQALVQAIARARRWFDQLASGEQPSVTAIARAEGVTERWVSRLLPLAFLSPKLVRAVLDGRQPVDLTAQRLIYRFDLPAVWAEQERVLGLAY